MSLDPYVNVRFGGDTTEVIRALRQVTRQSKKQGNRISSNFKAVGASIVAALSFDKIVEGLSFATEFDDNLRTAQAASKATSEELEALRAKALALGGEPGQTPLEIAKGMTEAARAGQSFNEIMNSVGSTAELAAASELEFGEAAEKTTDIMSQFNITSENTGRVTDVLIAGANSAATSVTQLAEAFEYSGSLSNALGKSFEQTAAAQLALANAGLKGEKGGTALRGVWAQLISNQETLEKQYGVTVSRVEDGKTVFADLADIIDGLNAAGIQADEIFDVFGKTAGPGAAALLNQGGDAIRGYTKQLNEAKGTGAEVGGVIQAGMGGDSRTIISGFQNAIIELADLAVPAMSFMADNIGILSGAVDILKVSVSGLQAVYATMAVGITQVAAFGESVTDALGITSEDTKVFAQVSEDMMYVAGNAADEAKEKFLGLGDASGPAVEGQKEHKKAVDESTTAVKSLADEQERLEDVQRSVSEVLSGIARQEAEERKQLAQKLYDELGIASTEFYQEEAQRILSDVDKYGEVVENKVLLQTQAMERLKELEVKAASAGDQAATETIRSMQESLSLAKGTMDEYLQAFAVPPDTQAFEAYAEAELASLEKAMEARRTAGVDAIQIEENKAKVIRELAVEAAEAGNEAYAEQLASLADQAEETINEIKGVYDAAGEAANGDLEARLQAIETEYETRLQLGEESIEAEKKRNEELKRLALDAAQAGETAYASFVGSLMSEVESSVQNVAAATDQAESELNSLANTAENVGSQVQGALDNVSAPSVGGFTTDTSSIESLQAAIQNLNETPTLDPFRIDRDRYQAKIEEMEAEASATIKKAQEELDREREAAAEKRAQAEEQRRRESVERAKQAAQEKLEIAKAAINEEINSIQAAEDRLQQQQSLYEKIYSSQGIGAKEAFQAKAENLTEEAQEMQDAGVKQGLVAQWLKESFADLREEAKEAGVKGFGSFTQGLLDSYKDTGLFSERVVTVRDEMQELKDKLAAVSESGYQQYMESSALAMERLVNGSESLRKSEDSRGKSSKKRGKGVFGGFASIFSSDASTDPSTLSDVIKAINDSKIDAKELAKELIRR